MKPGSAAGARLRAGGVVDFVGVFGSRRKLHKTIVFSVRGDPSVGLFVELFVESLYFFEVFYFFKVFYAS